MKNKNNYEDVFINAVVAWIMFMFYSCLIWFAWNNGLAKSFNVQPIDYSTALWLKLFGETIIATINKKD